jgi:group I intron endonuclease
MKNLQHETFIYFIENKITDKIYVGKTIDPNRRWIVHKNIAKGGKAKQPNKFSAIHAAIVKYGVDNFMFNVAECYPTNDAACEAEKYWISYLRNCGLSLYNETDGGDGVSPGTIFTEQRRRNISLSKLGKKASPEARLNMSRARKLEFAGEKNNKSKITEDAVKKLRELYSSGEYTYRGLAKIFNLTHATVGKIITYKLWPHVK